MVEVYLHGGISSQYIELYISTTRDLGLRYDDLFFE